MDAQSIALLACLVVVLLCTSSVCLMMLRQSAESRVILQRLSGEKKAVPIEARENLLGEFGLLRWIGSRLSTKKGGPAIRQSLLQAGIYGTNAGAIYIGAKVTLLLFSVAVVGAVLSFVPLSPVWGSYLSLFLVGFFFFLPNMYLARKKRDRMHRVRAALPSAIDLVEICVDAGMSLDTAWKNVGEEIGRIDKLLSVEMRLTQLERSIGVPKDEAMRRMSERTQVKEIAAFSTLLAQADRFGSSISSALRTFTETLRDKDATQAEEAAQKMAVKMLFPMVIFIFPSLLLITMGPAMLNLAKNL